MSLIVLHLGTRYDVCRYNTLWVMSYDIILVIFVTSELHPWTSVSVKVSCTLTIRCTLCCCMLEPRLQFVCSIEIEIWITIWRKLRWQHNDVIIHSLFMNFKCNFILCQEHIKVIFLDFNWSNLRLLKS